MEDQTMKAPAASERTKRSSPVRRSPRLQHAAGGGGTEDREEEPPADEQGTVTITFTIPNFKNGADKIANPDKAAPNE